MAHAKKRNFEDELRRIYSIPPNDLGIRRLTMMYKMFTGPLKQKTLFYIVPLSLLIAVLLYLMLGQLTIQLVNLLQYGF